MHHSIVRWNQSVPQANISINNIKQNIMQLEKINKKKESSVWLVVQIWPVIIGLSGRGDETGGCDESKIPAGLSVALPTLRARTGK